MVSRERPPWWRNTRGEWWVVAQTVLLLATALVPSLGPPWSAGAHWLPMLGLVVGAVGLTVTVLGARTLGDSLTLLPRPPEGGRLVRAAVYRVVRHPIYSGVILMALGWALARRSSVHLAFAATLFLLFDAKARREERWLMDRFPEYASYRRHVRKLIPWIY